MAVRHVAMADDLPTRFRIDCVRQQLAALRGVSASLNVHDASHKRRNDFAITDEALIKQTQQRIMRRINPEVEKVHFFKPIRMERYIVSCYAAEDGGHFRAHRGNTTRGTAHRRFAVSIRH